MTLRLPFDGNSTPFLYNIPHISFRLSVQDVQTNIARYVLRSTKLNLLHKTLAMCMEPAVTPKS